jgi:hypothetical protein
MQAYRSTLERAFELARSSGCRDVGEIRRKLRSEGHEGVEAHLSGRQIGDQLRRLIAERS